MLRNVRTAIGINAVTLRYTKSTLQFSSYIVVHDGAAWEPFGRLKNEGRRGSAGAGAALSHPLLDEGVFVLHLPLLHGRVDDQLVQLHRAKQQGQDT